MICLPRWRGTSRLIGLVLNCARRSNPEAVAKLLMATGARPIEKWCTSVACVSHMNMALRTAASLILRASFMLPQRASGPKAKEKVVARARKVNGD